jgi:predicted transcriptional regulator
MVRCVVDAEQRRGWGDLAQAIVDAVTRAGAPVTPAQVRDSLGGDLAYTTVMTVMSRLNERGVLARQRAGRAFAYTVVGDPAQITARRMHRLLEVDDDRAGVLARFVDDLTPQDEQLLRELLDRAPTDEPADKPGSSGRQRP